MVPLGGHTADPENPEQAEFAARISKRRRNHIIEDILTLKCGTCKAAFLDYDGCAAVRCGNCRNYFCGLCLLTFTGSLQAHRHVLGCRHNVVGADGQNRERGLFVPAEIRNSANRLHRIERVNRYVLALPEREMLELLESLSAELSEFDITTEDIVTAVQA